MPKLCLRSSAYDISCPRNAKRSRKNSLNYSRQALSKKSTTPSGWQIQCLFSKRTTTSGERWWNISACHIVMLHQPAPSQCGSLRRRCGRKNKGIRLLYPRPRRNLQQFAKLQVEFEPDQVRFRCTIRKTTRLHYQPPRNRSKPREN